MNEHTTASEHETFGVRAKELEHFDVVIVGAGLSGIGAAWRLNEARSNDTYCVLESRSTIGGTWDLFRYPGIRSDSDMFTLGYPFRPWNNDNGIADGTEILEYIHDTAEEGNITENIRFNRRVVRASWSTEARCWTLDIEVQSQPVASANVHAADEPTVEHITCGYLFSCAGYYRYDHGYTPEIEGLDTFEGDVVHPQQWPEELDYEDRRVVVIGSGATAVTLIPALAKTAKHVTMLQRSPTYVTPLPRTSPLAKAARRVTPRSKQGSVLKWVNAVGTQAFYELAKRRPTIAKKLLRKGVELSLDEGYDIDTHFTPSYDPWDQRLCVAPDGDLFRAINAGTASVVTDHIDHIEADKIVLTSGDTLEADIVVTATGLELLFIGGMELVVDGESVDVSERFVYKGMMLENVPNFAMAIGYTNASWTLKSDLISQYVVSLLGFLDQHDMASAAPLPCDLGNSGTPILNLTAGYVQRSQHLFPKQADADPWHVRQSYLADYRLMKNKRDFETDFAFTAKKGLVR